MKKQNGVVLLVTHTHTLTHCWGTGGILTQTTIYTSKILKHHTNRNVPQQNTVQHQKIKSEWTPSKTTPPVTGKPPAATGKQDLNPKL